MGRTNTVILMITMLFSQMMSRVASFVGIHPQAQANTQAVAAASVLHTKATIACASSKTNVNDEQMKSPEAEILQSAEVSNRVVNKSKRGGKRSHRNRLRQHVNPLASRYQQPATFGTTNFLPDVFTDHSKPLHLDIGCGKGRFILEVADADLEKRKNYLGIEIRPQAVEFALKRLERDHEELKGSLYYISCNANVDLDRMLGQYTGSITKNEGDSDKATSGGSIDLVSIQFPDPHFKEAHKKRRVVTPIFVDTLAKYMLPGSTIFLQSDVKPVLDDMRERFRASPYFKDDLDSENDYIEENPIGIRTEREISVLNRDLGIWRVLLRRTDLIYDLSSSSTTQIAD